MTETGQHILKSINAGSAADSYDAVKDRASRDYRNEASESSILRIAPLLFVAGGIPDRKIFIGDVRVVVSDLHHAAFEVHIKTSWSEINEDHFEMMEFGLDELNDLTVHNFPLLQELPDWPPTPPVDQEGLAAYFAKAISEQSRDCISQLREIRYGLENRLAHHSSHDSGSEDHASVVSSLLQLNIILGRTADQAREAVREGLWVYISDEEAYHSYRRLQDPSIINEYPPATADLRPWMRLHDAAVRQCGELRKQADAEAGSVRALLASASSISNAWEAEAQSRFNVLLAVVSVGLGVPALVLALYGAEVLVPLNTPPRVLAFAPVAAGLLLAAFIAVLKAPKGRHRAIWRLGAGVILLALALLVAAGISAPA
ncbi:hypothetical protein [Arthrobacter sp. B0490]|uniref:hypothetical protein n=1 Tax=Arthrobacter sp. B0490 TaxID=2058891 RepID=UPI0011AFD718|nr:hypothetical protein [Arthrobacter sp. B0490]